MTIHHALLILLSVSAVDIPDFFKNRSGYLIVGTTTKWDVAASKHVDDYDHVMAKVGQENNL